MDKKTKLQTKAEVNIGNYLNREKVVNKCIMIRSKTVCNLSESRR